VNPLRPIAPGALLVAALLSPLGCEPDAAPDAAPDLFRLAVNGLPGGALLSVYGDALASRAYLAGGYVAVDPSRLDGRPAGRMLTYDGRGNFRTACTADAVLWWTAPVDGLAWASGERGRVVRYRDGGACEVVPTGLAFAEGEPTFWGFAQRGSETWFVGGSAAPDGPKGVLVRYDGRTFARVEVPPEARDVNLYKIDARTERELVVVGEGGVAFRLRDGVATMTPTGLAGSDSRLFTVSCSAFCWAVGGQNVGVVLRGRSDLGVDGTGDFRWEPAPFPAAQGWSGVWSLDVANTFFVGVAGQTMHVGTGRAFMARSLTPATLHGVGGWFTPRRADAAVVLAVGGELGTADASQRAVILVRGDDSATFTVDGTAFVPTGELRRALGGAGQ
jgi:hypothetical protein